MELFTYLMAKNDHNTSVRGDLFSYLLGKGQSGTYTDYSGTSLSINNTKKGKMKVNLLGNTSQTGTPTPSTPIPVNVVSGDNTINVTGNNFFNIDRTLGTPSDTAGANTTKRTFDISTFVKGLSVNNYYNTGIAIDYTFIDNGIKITTNQGGYALAFPLLLKPNTTYTISANISPIGTERLRAGYYQKDGTFISFEINYSSNNYFSFTTPSNAYYTLIHLTPSANTEVTFTNIMLNEGNTALPYEPYQSTSYPINLPDGMFLGEISTYKDRFLRNSGKNLMQTEYYNTTNYVSQELSLKAGDYYVSYTGDNSSAIYLRKADGTTPINGTSVKERYNGTTLGFTLTEAGNYYIQFYKSGGYTTFTNAMLELGTELTHTDYEPYGTNEWYLEKKIGKETDTIGSNSKTISDMVSNGSIYSYCGGTVSGTTITYDSALTVANTIYYQKVSPTYTKITDSTLISQLENVWRANSYKGQTNISQVNDDLPFNLDVEVKVGS